VGLILVRHARVEADGRCYGRIDLEPGPDLAAAARSVLACVGPVDRIVSSPLRRCRCLAAAIGARWRVPVRLDPDWREMDFGTWEGIAWKSVPRAELDAWAADFMHARPHGGESVAMLLARVRRAIARSRRGNGRTLGVVHAGSIRAALFAAGGGSDAWRRPVAFGEAVDLARPRRRLPH
jgi:alpha-ribazole phosphatase